MALNTAAMALEKKRQTAWILSGKIVRDDGGVSSWLATGFVINRSRLAEKTGKGTRCGHGQHGGRLAEVLR